VPFAEYGVRAARQQLTAWAGLWEERRVQRIAPERNGRKSALIGCLDQARITSDMIAIRGGKPMVRRTSIIVAVVAAVAATAGMAQGQFGTAAEAKAMLEKAVAAVKADKAKALADFNAGAAGFKDRDLYVFCAGPDGIISAHPSIKGKQIKDLVDKNGKKLGEDIVANGAEGKIAEVSYMWPRPGADTTPVQKVSYVTKVADQVCGVGYYK
jgi:Single Cache domain 2